MNIPAIDERAQRLLKTLVESYIREGQPIGSKTLLEESGMALSPATVRNVMADLEAQGYVHSPHTSAGRVPTVAGYRFFVDCLLTLKPLDPKTVQKFQSGLTSEKDVQGLVTTASSLLSQVTRFAGVVTLPRRSCFTLRQIEFLPLSEKRVLAILVLSDHEVQNRIIYMPRDYSAHELQQVANYLNAQFAGKDLLSVRKELLAALQHERKHIDEMMRSALEVAGKTFGENAEEADYVFAGHAHLLDLADETGVDRLRQLFDAFNEKRKILHLLDKCLLAEGIQIFIGKESGYDLLGDCSIVTAPYSVDDKIVGVLGIIGPTRMPYERVISTVDLTAKLLTDALNSS